MKFFKTKHQGILCFIASFLFIITLLLTCVDLNCFNRDSYKREYKRLNTANTLEVTSTELNEITQVLLDYTQGKRGDLFVEVEKGTQKQEVFNQKEKDHMVDVKALYLNAMHVRNATLLISIICFIFALIYQKKPRCFVFKHFKKAGLIFFSMLIALCFFALIDFTAFWTLFHEIFFSNDLWLLNPATDILIMLVPESFFFNLVMRIVISFVACLMICYGVLFVFARKEENV